MLMQLPGRTLRGPLVISDVVYAELSVRYNSIEELDAMLSQAAIEIASTPRAALFLVGKAFQRYRAAGGSKTGVLPDFFIGAHAAISNLPLLTRDARRYRTYFPKVELIAPSA
jgi:predicted nucleic acid-binding protein